mmetsp:Transcript_20105/g.27636  ORF Transcript_20105/g.27636 Transcript_20105/m.27636 type:complete len:82 (+) Transcript_20105:314-559(+)
MTCKSTEYLSAPSKKPKQKISVIPHIHTLVSSDFPRPIVTMGWLLQSVTIYKYTQQKPLVIASPSSEYFLIIIVLLTPDPA